MNAKILLTISVLGLSGAALAATEDRGFYFGTGAGEAEAKDAEDFGLRDDTETAFRLFGGYEFSRYLAAEVGYVDFGHYSGSIPTIEGPARTRIGLDGFSVGLRPQLELGRNWFVQAQLGAFIWDADAVVDGAIGRFRETDNGKDPYWGIGVGRSFAGTWRLSGEWTRFETDESDVDFLNLAMSYRIGK